VRLDEPALPHPPRSMNHAVAVALVNEALREVTGVIDVKSF